MANPKLVDPWPRHLEVVTADADTWCANCAEKRGWDQDGAVDSEGNEVQWVFAGMECDTPTNCAGCGTFLPVPLTGHGEDYVAEALHDYLAIGMGVRSVLVEWAEEFHYLPMSQTFLKAVKA
jgi:hypothetical protein